MSVTALVLLATLAQAGVEKAPPPQDKARAQHLLMQGSSLYERGDYGGALEMFNAAYKAYPSPKIWFNIAQANRDLGRPVEALQAFESFIAGAADAAPVTMNEARASVAELQSKLARLRIDSDPAGAEISLDGKVIGRTPLADAIWAVPGRHQLTASYPGAPPSIEYADLVAGSLLPMTIRLAVPAAPPPVVAPPPPEGAQVARAAAPAEAHGWWLGRKWTWVAAGSTVLLAAGAGTYGLLMQSKYDDLNKSCGSGSATRPGCSESDIDAVSTRKNVANVLWVATGAAAVTTGLLFYFEGRSVAVTPMVGQASGISLQGRF